MSRRVLAILPVLVGLSWADGSDAYAESEGEDEEPVVVQYRVPPGCPTEEAFIDQLRQRGIRAPLAAPDEKARTFQIDVKIETRPHGRLTVIGLDGKRVTRTVAGRSCEELVSGLAVMTAVAISPLAIAEAPPEPAPPAPAAPAAPAPTPVPPTEAPRSNEATPRTRAAAPIEVGTGIRAFTLLTVAPEPILGVGAFVDLSLARSSLRVGIDQTYPIRSETDSPRRALGGRPLAPSSVLRPYRSALSPSLRALCSTWASFERPIRAGTIPKTTCASGRPLEGSCGCASQCRGTGTSSSAPVGAEVGLALGVDL